MWLEQADEKGCGFGKGADCCIFLVSGVHTMLACARGTELHDTLVIRRGTMCAKRMPDAPYPECKLTGQ